MMRHEGRSFVRSVYLLDSFLTERGRESPLRKLWDERPISWRSQACKDLVVFFSSIRDSNKAHRDLIEYAKSVSRRHFRVDEKKKRIITEGTRE